jgi:prevent-host-death family protein
MSSYSVADAGNSLPSLIDKALAGEEVVITRDGKPVVELRPADRVIPRDIAGAHRWLEERRDRRKSVSITSVQLLNQMYESDD